MNGNPHRSAAALFQVLSHEGRLHILDGLR